MTSSGEWSLLASLDETERAALLASTRLRRFGRGETLVHEGDPAQSLHLVASGRLAVRVSSSRGDSVTLNVLGPGAYFGELSLLDTAHVRSASVVALEDAETRSLTAAAFHDLRRRHRAAEDLLLTLMSRRVQELSGRLLEALYEGLDRRVYRRLLELVAVYDDGGRDPVTIPLTQEHLAGLVGGTRPSVNQVLQRLAGEGALEIGRGRLRVLDRVRLARRAG